MATSFDGRMISSDGGALLLEEVDKHIGLIGRFGCCFVDGRANHLVEHPHHQLFAQRVFGLALGYEDLNDHDALRRDPVLAAVWGQADVLGARRRRADVGCALAGTRRTRSAGRSARSC